MGAARFIGWFAIGLALLALPLGLLDPVLTGFALWIALLCAGLSSAGTGGASHYAVITLLISFVGGLIASHYSYSSGFFAPTRASVTGLVFVLAIPAVVAVIGAAVGWVRRRV